MDGVAQKSWASTAQSLGIDYTKIAYTTPIIGLSVIPDKVLNLFATPDGSKDADILKSKFNAVAMKVCYCSFYKECWLVLNNSVEPQQVNSCELQAWNDFIEPTRSNSLQIQSLVWAEMASKGDSSFMATVTKATLKKGYDVTVPPKKIFDVTILFKGIYQGNKEDYNNLEGQSQGPTSEFFKMLIRQVQEDYIAAENIVRNLPLCKADLKIACSEDETEGSTDTFGNILWQFIHQDFWISRARAAYLLRFLKNDKIEKSNKRGGYQINWKNILSSLIKSIADSKEHLLVSKTALDTFRVLVPEFQKISPIPTEDKPNTVFDFNQAIDYWQKNKDKIIATKEMGQ